LEEGEMLEGIVVGDVIGLMNSEFTYVVKGVDGNVLTVAYLREDGFESHTYEVSAEVFNRFVRRAYREIVVGSEVTINPNSQYYGSGRLNPKDVRGRVEAFHADYDHKIEVVWEGVGTNYYRLEDLEFYDVRFGTKAGAKKKAAKPSLISQAVEKLKPARGNSSFVIIHDNKLSVYLDRACHANINHRGNDTIKKIQWVVSSIANGIDENPSYYKWLIDESMWAPAFRYRYTWSKKNKCVVVHTDIADNFMMSALIATRMGWESLCHTTFNELRKLGIPGEFALYLASATRQRGGNLWKVDVSTYGHWPFENTRRLDYVKAMFTGVLPNLNPTTYRESKSYSNVNGLWQGRGDRTDIFDFLPQAEVQVFGRIERRPKDLTDQELLAFVAKVKEEALK